MTNIRFMCAAFAALSLLSVFAAPPEIARADAFLDAKDYDRAMEVHLDLAKRGKTALHLRRFLDKLSSAAGRDKGIAFVDRVLKLPLGDSDKGWACWQGAALCRKNGDFARGAAYADRAVELAHGVDWMNALQEGLKCRLRTEGEAAWDWLEKIAKRSSSDKRANDAMNAYGYQAFCFLRPERARYALAWLKKRGMKPGHYANRWLTAIKTYDEYEKFPRDEKDIVFPEAPTWFGTAKGKTVRVKDLGFNPDDMTAVIQKAIDDPATGTLVFDKTDAPWRISSLKPRSNLVFVFEDGVRFLADKETQEKNPRDVDLFKLHNVSNVVFVGKGATSAGVRIGKYATREERRKFGKDYGGSGFSIDSCQNIVIDNLTVAECTMDGLLLGGLASPPSGIYVRNVVLDGNLRQACSLCNVNGIYFKNVAFNNTSGRAPMCGIDVEPSIQEVQAVSEIYLFDCTFSGNAGSHIHFSCSSSYPVTMHAKRCSFEPHPHSALVDIFALPGIYFGAGVAAPSKIIFEACDFRQYGDRKAIRFQNSSFFNVDFRNSTVEEIERGRQDAGAPVAFDLQRTYAKNDCDKPGKVVFDNLRVKGWKDRPTIAFHDRSGTYSVTNLHGTIVHNKKKVNASSFRHAAREKTLDPFPAFDPAAYAPLKKASKTTETSVPLRMKLTSGGQWYEPKPKYQAIYWDGKAWQTRDAAPDMKNLADLAGKPVAFVGKPVMSWGAHPVDFSPAYQITAGKDLSGDTVYFEVPAGAKECVIRLLGDAEIRSASGRLVGAYESATDALKGVKYIRFKPLSKKSEIYSIRIPKYAAIKFFHPLTGVIAEKQEWLPRLKK